MKGSHKFWSIIVIVISIYLHYLTWCVYTNMDGGWIFLRIAVLIIDFLVIFAIIGIFIEFYLPTFNNWLDEKF